VGVLAFRIPDGADVGVGEALFESGLLVRIGWTREDGIVVREGVGADILAILAKVWMVRS